MKSLTLKIAVGVFLGVMAALILYSLPEVYRKHEAAKREEGRTNLSLRLRKITPEEFSATCGKIVKDKSVNIGDAKRPYIIRDITVRNKYGKEHTAEFFDSDPDEFLGSIDGLDFSKDDNLDTINFIIKSCSETKP